MNNIKKLTYSGLLTALAIIIPLTFGFLKIHAGPFSATLASHVPMFMAMFLGPGAAVMVGVGSGIGFLLTAPAVIAARAFMHTFVGLAGAYLLKKDVSFGKVILITGPIHAILEALIVIPFGFSVYKFLVVVGLGTLIHHMVDGIISLGLVNALSKSLKMDLKKVA
ncbi:ECF transporter S component [Clostridium sp. DJ247]|uniref:ECF transporter S component n=1 Tax=Clostridium sp. DJ247 TaxID=2726188 RepID=UPI001628822E|nr:ECF transporter S component [Clostridium sp. DJ247]MBC2580098.1 ECF transporter S component [Clostridium sp. DJ247]